MKTYKIYKYTNLITGMSYIGQTCQTLKKRAGLNMIKYRECEKFWEAIQHYGTDCWSNEILWDGLTLDEANIYEQVEIKDNETLYPYGYNLSYGSEQSEETIRKRTESLRRNPPMLGKTHSKKTKQRLSEIGKTNPASIQVRMKATQAAAEANRGKERPAEICEKMSISRRKPDYTEMHNFFLSLPTDMYYSMKVRLLREQFPDVSNSTLYFRIRQWTDIKGKKQHPDRPEVYQFFLSLPSDMPLPKKRHLLQKEFPNIRKYLLNRWLNKWSGTKTLIRHPDKVPARGFFLSLPADMVLSEKESCSEKNFQMLKGTLSINGPANGNHPNSKRRPLMTKPEIHEMIKDLRRNAPRLLARAKIRADRLSQHNRIECPICATGAVMDILPRLST